MDEKRRPSSSQIEERRAVPVHTMRRELDEIECLNWCFGQPYNIVIAIRIRGNIPPDRLQSALDKAQQRHPLLRVNDRSIYNSRCIIILGWSLFSITRVINASHGIHEILER